jgi:hypothetical protein
MTLILGAIFAVVVLVVIAAVRVLERLRRARDLDVWPGPSGGHCL